MQGENSHVSQVDFVPTISLLLGLPVPFSNLGTVMVDLFNHCPWWKTSNNKVKQVFHTVEALRLNAHQVHNYLEEYSRVSSDFPYRQLKDSDHLFKTLETDVQNLVNDIYVNKNEKGALSKFEAIQKGYMKYLKDVKEMSKNVWAKFDQGSMIVGISLVVMATTLTVCLLNSSTDMSVYLFLTGSVWGAILMAFVYLTISKESSIVLAITFGFVIIGIVIISLFKLFDEDQKSRKGVVLTLKSMIVGQSLESIFALLGVCIYCLSMSSNSFVVYEDAVSTFLSQSMMAVAVYKAISYHSKLRKVQSSITSKKHQNARKIDINMLSSPEAIIVMLFTVFLLIIRVSVIFRACREEQWTCEDTYGFLQQLSSLSEKHPRFKNIRYFLSILSNLIISIGFYQWMRYYGNLNGYSPSVLSARYLPLSASVALCFYWALQGLPHKLLDALPPWQVVILPRFVYLVAFVTILALLVNPLCIFQMAQSPSQEDMIPLVTDTADSIVPRVYSHLKLNWKKHFHSHSHHQNADSEDSVSSSRENTPIVYGLATAYSSAVLLLVVMVMLVTSMLLGDGLALGMLMLMLSLLVSLEIHGSNVRLKRKELSLPGKYIHLELYS